jgi:pimeloyl-ACP methyl ester carboxylesterase
MINYPIMPDITTKDGIKLSYLEYGTGAPLIFIHGFGAAAMVWEETCLAFENRNRCLALDLRGHGDSEWHGHTAKLEDFVSDLVFFFDELDLQKANLVGWSFGSEVCLAAYPRLKERLASLILVGGTSHFLNDHDYIYGMAPTLLKRITRQFERDGKETLNYFFELMFKPFDINSLDFKEIRHFWKRQVKPPNPLACLAVLEILRKEDVRGYLKEVLHPTLIIHGRDDTVCPADGGAYMQEQIADCSLAWIDETGHAPFLLKPVEFNKALEKFLNELDR